MASELWTSFHHWERSASLDESVMRMEAFTSTCLSTSDGSFDHEEQMYSMWTVSTQTCRLLAEHQTRDTITRSRMETLSAEVLNDPTTSPAELEIARLIRNGLKSRVRHLEMSFGRFATSWIRNRLRATSILCQSTPTGNLQRCLPCMSHHTELKASRAAWTEEIIGYNNLVLDVENHS